MISLLIYEMKTRSLALSADVEDIVSADEGVSVFVLELSIVVFFGLFESNVHETVQTRENS